MIRREKQSIAFVFLFATLCLFLGLSGCAPAYFQQNIPDNEHLKTVFQCEGCSARLLEDTDTIWVMYWVKGKGIVMSPIDRKTNNFVNNPISFSNPIVPDRRQGEDLAINGIIWSTNMGTNQLASYDTKTQQVRGIVSVNRPYALASGEDAIWAAQFPTEESKYRQEIYRIDPGTHKVIATIPLDYQTLKIVDADTLIAMIDRIAVDQGLLWATVTTYKKSFAATNPHKGFLLKIDPSSQRVMETIPVGTAANSIAINQGVIWIGNAHDSTVSRIDPRSGNVVATIPVAQKSQGLVAGSDSVWVAAHHEGMVQRIDVKTNQVQTILVGFLPRIAANKNTAWVIVQVVAPNADPTYKLKRVTP